MLKRLCVCVCERERERERFTTLGKIYNTELDLHHQICTDVL
jgi:hypothetical protein